MRYRDNLPLALKGLKFSIKQKEKIGIVGRSGSGKYEACFIVINSLISQLIVHFQHNII